VKVGFGGGMGQRCLQRQCMWPRPPMPCTSGCMAHTASPHIPPPDSLVCLPPPPPATPPPTHTHLFYGSLLTA
jgi:hypothetical protein